MGRVSDYGDSNHFGVCESCRSRMECIDSRTAETYRRRRLRCPECKNCVTTREIYLEDYQHLTSTQKAPIKVLDLLRQLKEIVESPDIVV